MNIACRHSPNISHYLDKGPAFRGCAISDLSSPVPARCPQRIILPDDVTGIITDENASDIFHNFDRTRRAANRAQSKLTLITITRAAQGTVASHDHDMGMSSCHHDNAIHQFDRNVENFSPSNFPNLDAPTDVPQSV